MSWVYSQSTGQFFQPDGKPFIKAFAGQGIGLNEPQEEGLKNTGPLPRGKYKMVQWFQMHPHVGAGAIQLEPDPSNDMKGRSGFFIHGLNITDPLHSSEGCIILGNTSHRLSIWQDPDHDLIVNA